ncbi:TPA: MucBP domain-containing protein [Streptococcus suis]|uniref:MucBP domain-containing protein n=1 Tax=Streptococcus suis TaxID=1307 RepID=UPI001C9DE0BE|nr:MucBP domain-containing protein [Streptococcus suis]QZS60397.1 MucBP domain-containing protein [Streptococcus suis]HEM3462025.1 MucBP domain-containing protein [Streptococcus suis]HEM6494535.1 MucBP domain-containing protein [Streptococcus suis]
MFKDQSKKMIKKQEYFSLRKFKRGLASVTVGATLFMAGAAVESFVAPQVVAYAAEETYSANGEWTFTDDIPSNNANVNPQMTAWAYTAHTTAESTITEQDGSTVTVTATITPTNGNEVGVSYLVPGENQAAYSATPDMLAGTPEPASIPAMGIYLQPSPSTPAADFSEKLNYSGEVENAELTLTFSEEVTNPIIDLSGIGGSGKAIVDDVKTGEVFLARGSFNSTNFKLVTPDVKLEKITGTNLTVTDTTINVTEKNTYDKAVVGNDDMYLWDYRLPNLVPAGTGSIRLVGTFKQVTFKLFHQSTPFTEYPTETYKTDPVFFNSTSYGDGVNGLNKFWSEKVEDVGNSTTNADLLRFSVRLSNTKYGSVIVNYVDTEGNVIGTEFKDTTNQAVGTAYDTTTDSGTVASDATTERPAVITKDGKTYKLVAKDTTATVGTVKADGSLSENAGSFTFGTDTPTGTVAEGTKSITYVYEEVKGSVIVDYVDTDGNKIGTQFVDTANVAPGTAYNTANDTGTKASTDTSERPSVITKDGKTYKLVPAGDYNVGTVGTDGNLTATTKDLGTDAVSGEVAEGTKKVTYVYQEVKTGSVVVDYVDTEGNVLQKQYVDSPEGTAVGTAYNAEQITGTTEKPAVIEKDGKTYELVPAGTYTVGTVGEDNNLTETSTSFGVAPVTGTVAEGVTKITYVYKEKVETPKTGNVVITYVDTEGLELKTTVKDTTDGEVGSTYNTKESADEYPETIEKDGVTYKRVVAGTHKVGETTEDGHLVSSDAAEGTVEEGTKTVTYVYEKVETPVVKTGSVVARYVIEGTEDEIADDKSVKPTDTPVGEPYGDTPPATITKDGKTYELVRTRTNEGDAPENGVVKEGEQTITYEYKEKVETPVVKTGSVVARYVIEGTEDEIADDKSVKPTDTPVDEPYGDTPPATITKDGKTYELVRTRTNEGDAPDNGVVKEGEQTITYEYKEKVETPVVKTGSVVARYVIEGTEDEIADDKSVKPTDTPVDEPYGDTPPATIEKNGKTYELVRTRTNEGDAPENGVVKEGEQTITYEYKEKVETPVVKTGSVVARYVIEGTETEIADDKTVKPTDTPVDEVYGDTPPATITKDGKTYELVRTRTNEGDAPSNGTVVEGEQTITYEYKEKVETPVVKTGSVVARYVIEGTETEIADDKTVKPTDTPVDEVYGDTPPTTISFGGKTYTLVRTRTNEGDAPSNGTVVEGEQTITYEYKEVVDTPDPVEKKTGSVLVRHITDKGEVLADTTDVVRDGEVGSTYETTVGNFEGYTFVKVDETGATPTGEVEEGEKTVVYIYTKVETPVAKTGSVLVRHITDKGEVLADTTDVVRDGEVGSTYETTVGNFEGYTFVKVDETGATPTGEVEEGEKTVVYIYTKVETPVVKTGSVVARYVIEGTETEIADDKAVKPTDTPVDEVYGDTPPATITKDGKTYELVRTRTNEGDAPSNGTVVEGEQTITYEYKEKEETPVVKTGSVVARYVIEGTETEIADDKSVKPTDTPVDEPYGDTPPATITKDGKTYELVRTRTNEGDAPSNGTVVEGEQTITYEYKEVVETPVVPPVVEKQGKVIVHYVDENGNVIKTPVVDTENGTVGGDYDTSDNRPKVIVFNGKRYILVESRIPNNAKGKVVEGETHVTYVYKQENEEPTTPTIPTTPTTPSQPTTPSTTPVTETTKVTPKTSAILPQTGESTSALALVGLALLGTVAVASRRRKEK